MGLAAGLSWGLAKSESAAEQVRADRKLTAAIIGHTGKGNYGHSLELIFNDRENIQVVAVADPNPTGRAKAAAQCKALRQYANYPEMLEKEKPSLVCIAPRWTDQHHAMGLAALQSGAHVCMEKPFTQTLAEADDLLRTADQADLKIAVAHQMRVAPSTLHLKKALDAGLIGTLLEIRGHGKQDHRAGGEDMVVLGTHLFDLVRMFAGDPLFCTARVLQNGHDIKLKDVRQATENIGPIAGDEIHATFAFPNGVNFNFTSRSQFRETAGPWGLELIGTKGIAKILAEMAPRIYLLKNSAWSTEGRNDSWHFLEGDPTVHFAAAERGFVPANRLVADDWLDAIEANREPICSGRAAMKSLEMIMAAFAAGLSQSRVPMPLSNRSHPLVQLKAH